MRGAKPVFRGNEAVVSDELYMEIGLRGNLAMAVLREAKRLNKRPIDLVADVLDRVFLEGLVTAILDE